jgi:hypothetical protein
MAFRPLRILDGQDDSNLSSDMSRTTLHSPLKYKARYNDSAVLTTAL